MDEGEEAFGVLVEAREDAPEVLEFADEALDQVALPIGGVVAGARTTRLFFGGMVAPACSWCSIEAIVLSAASPRSATTSCVCLPSRRGIACGLSPAASLVSTNSSGLPIASTSTWPLWCPPYWFGGGGCGYTLLGLSVAVDGGMVLGYGDLRRLAGSDKQRSGFVR